jgi:hypothetical protein
MGRLRFASSAGIAFAITSIFLLPACGGHKSAPVSPYPAKITLNPTLSYSMQVGSVLQLSATAQNATNTNIAPAFTYALTGNSAPGILDIAPNGVVCAGSWNAPAYSVCTPGATGTVQVTASALGASSAPTIFFVHEAVDNIQISYVPIVTAPPQACPGQTSLPVACLIKATPAVQPPPSSLPICMSQNQIQTLQASAYSHGSDITASIGPFTWTPVNATVVTVTPLVTSTQYAVPTNQVTIAPNTPGQTQVVASASGFSSQPYTVETCPVQCISLETNVNGTIGETNFSVTKGTSETIAATAVDVQGCIVPKAPLTWVSTSPAAISAGGAGGCAAGSTCTITTTQPGAASITASCTPPTCNVGFPLVPAGTIAPYIPQAVYPITAISGLVTGATSSTDVVVTSRDCATDQLCIVGLYNVPTTNNLSGGGIELPTPPNSLMFDPAGDKAYMGSQFGAVAINPANLGSSSSPFSSLPAPGTPLGLVIGTVIAVSQNGSQAIFSDTISTPNQVYIVTSGATSATTTPLAISGAIAAAFSPDGMEAYILGNGGNTLYIYSSLQGLQAPFALATPATSIVFSSTGSFALLAGGGASPTTLAAFNTCDSSPITFPPPSTASNLTAPPQFLKMFPAGNVSLNSLLLPAALNPLGLDLFFGVDNTGIDIIATTTAIPNFSSVPFSPGILCPWPVTLAQETPLPTPPTPPNYFPPTHINIGTGTFNPIAFFILPDATQAYIVTSNAGVLVYNFNTLSSSTIALLNNATPISADMTVDGSSIYVAASDGLLHILNTALGIDETSPTAFPPLPNSTSSFCYTANTCAANIVAVKP